MLRGPVWHPSMHPLCLPTSLFLSLLLSMPYSFGVEMPSPMCMWSARAVLPWATLTAPCMPTVGVLGEIMQNNACNMLNSMLLTPTPSCASLVMSTPMSSVVMPTPISHSFVMQIPISPSFVMPTPISPSFVMQIPISPSFVMQIPISPSFVMQIPISHSFETPMSPSLPVVFKTISFCPTSQTDIPTLCMPS